jgi:hypothetical protein
VGGGCSRCYLETPCWVLCSRRLVAPGLRGAQWALHLCTHRKQVTLKSLESSST